jgi:hypothetical protein
MDGAVDDWLRSRSLGPATMAAKVPPITVMENARRGVRRGAVIPRCR